jgi:hypothetical protein
VAIVVIVELVTLYGGDTSVFQFGGHQSANEDKAVGAVVAVAL